ncbi:MAG: pantoate--beta-alanine ligase [Candidatus Acidiferrum sp.]
MHSINEMRAACRAAKTAGRRLGFVPTMGALHEGHLSLVRAARKSCQSVAASIFVNPTQFGPNEDFAKYPRTLERDQQLLEAEGVDMLFTPSPEEMYPPGATTFVSVEGLSERLDGASRPGHFRGVATVVAKLFNIAEPDAAFFGQKDAAQCAVIRRMVRDLALPVEIQVCPIVRDADGLALSSRNAYLSVPERKQALVLSRAVRRMAELYAQGEVRTNALLSAGKSVLAEEPAVRLDYLEMVNPETLEPVALMEARAQTLVAVAAYVGKTRLIDNILLGSNGVDPSSGFPALVQARGSLPISG